MKTSKTSSAAVSIEPHPSSLTKISKSYELLESCPSEDYSINEATASENEKMEESEAAAAAESIAGHREPPKQSAAPQRHCRRVQKKRMHPCVRREDVPNPNQVPRQPFEEKYPCRKLHPKPCRKRKRCVKRAKTKDEWEEYSGEEEELDGLGKEDGDHKESGRAKGSKDGYEDGDIKEGLEGEGSRDGEETGNDEKENQSTERKRPCKKKKKKRKRTKPLCRSDKPIFQEEKRKLFPSLPTPNLRNDPPLQKFPPAEDPSKPERQRREPCRKRKRKPCRKRKNVEDDLSSSSTCSSDSNL